MQEWGLAATGDVLSSDLARGKSSTDGVDPCWTGPTVRVCSRAVLENLPISDVQVSASWKVRGATTNALQIMPHHVVSDGRVDSRRPTPLTGAAASGLGSGPSASAGGDGSHADGLSRSLGASRHTGVGKDRSSTEMFETLFPAVVDPLDVPVESVDNAPPASAHAAAAAAGYDARCGRSCCPGLWVATLLPVLVVEAGGTD